MKKLRIEKTDLKKVVELLNNKEEIIEAQSEEIDMLRSIIHTTIETSEDFSRQDIKCRNETGKFLDKKVYRAFIGAMYQSLVISKECNTMVALGDALTESYLSQKEGFENEKK